MNLIAAVGGVGSVSSRCLGMSPRSPRKTAGQVRLGFVHFDQSEIRLLRLSRRNNYIKYPQGFINDFSLFLDERKNRLFLSSKNKKKKTLMNPWHPCLHFGYILHSSLGIYFAHFRDVLCHRNRFFADFSSN